MRRITRVALVAASISVAACQGSSSAKVALAPQFAPVSSAAREQTADQQVAQVLNRLTFGAKPGDVARVREIGVDRWIDWQLPSWNNNVIPLVKMTAYSIKCLNCTLYLVTVNVKYANSRPWHVDFEWVD